MKYISHSVLKEWYHIPLRNRMAYVFLNVLFTSLRGRVRYAVFCQPCGKQFVHQYVVL